MAIAVSGFSNVRADNSGLEATVRKRTSEIEEKLIAWRRDIHQHPELGDQEIRTGRLVAEHLRKLGLDVRTQVARTGVVGILKGAKPGLTVALRADMDALPVKEPPGLPFASKVTAKVNGKSVPIMHACGHDAHTAMLMAVAEVLKGVQGDIKGTILFIFQPAEEGSSIHAPASGNIWGAKLMLEEGLFKEFKPDAVFAIHVMPGRSGQISYRSGPVTASGDSLEITVTGKQGHGGMPWNTVDPITASALVISGLQTIVSRQVDLTAAPAVITIGTIEGGTRANIVADSVHMAGTIRTYDEKIREQMHRDVRRTAENIANSGAAQASVSITRTYDVTVNNKALAERMVPVLMRAADNDVAQAPLAGASEDFSFFAQQAPGLYVFLGVTPRDQDPAKAAPNHNPRFFVDESALVVGTRTLAFLAVNFLDSEITKDVELRPAQPFIQDDP
jgi:amidohydrolase